MMALFQAIDIKLIILIFCVTLFGSGLNEDETKMPSVESCKKFRKEIIWVSGTGSTVVLGKSDDSVQRCELTFGVSSSPKHEEARLKVEIEFMYIHDCGIEVQINESSNSMFSDAKFNHLMMKSNCNQKVPRVIYAQPKNFVRVWWYKKDKFLDAYNFRLNISMIDGLPVKGPALSTLVITGLIMFCSICVAGTLFFKFLSHVTSLWHERSVENAIDRALCVYNSQEPLPEEPDHVYLTPGFRGDGRQQTRFRPREPEIAFVHRDGRVERFRPIGITSSSEQLGASLNEHDNGLQSSTRIQQPQRARSQLAASTSDEGALGMPILHSIGHHKTSRKKRQGQEDTSSLAGNELPPTYEEAMGMPVPLSTAEESNEHNYGDSQIEDQEGHFAHQQAASTLNNVDYMNVTVDDRARPLARSVEQEEVILTESRSDAPLLAGSEDSTRLDSCVHNLATKSEKRK